MTDPTMGGWAEYVIAFAVFMASHAFPARPALRSRLVAMLGERFYLTVYITLSLVMLAWLIAAAGRAPHVSLWPVAPWQSWIPTVAMPLVCLLAGFGAGAVNPLSFGGQNPEAFNPDAPGIAGLTRHPLLWALALWAGAHIVPNGDLAHVILFGVFTLFALTGMAAIDRRKRRQLGEAAWARLAQRTSLVPFAALVTGRWRPSGVGFDFRRLAAALVLYAALLLLHPALIGVSPFPPV